MSRCAAYATGGRRAYCFGAFEMRTSETCTTKPFSIRVRRLAAVARKEYDMTRSIAVVVVPAFLFIAAGAAALQSSQHTR